MRQVRPQPRCACHSLAFPSPRSDPVPPQPQGKQEKAAYVEMRKGIIQIVAVENDRQPRSLIILTGLKTLFQKQLPKMPKDYIARLVYDRSHLSIAIVKHPLEVVGCVYV